MREVVAAGIMIMGVRETRFWGTPGETPPPMLLRLPGGALGDKLTGAIEGR